MRKLSPSIDLSLLDFLQYGDISRIAKKHREETGKKTHPNYVSAVCAGKHRNLEVLKIAFEVALERKGKLPMQALKSA